MSKIANMSRAGFYNKFKALTGISPGDYLRKYRLQKANLMLMENNLNINQISSEIGFQSVSHFRKSFKQEFGHTPSEWRNSKS